MKIYPVNSMSLNAQVAKKSLIRTDKNLYGQGADLNTIPTYYLPQRNNTNFNGHELKTELSRKELRDLKSEFKNLVRRYNIELKKYGFDDVSKATFEDDYILQFAEFILKHKIIENEGVRDSFRYIFTSVYLSSDRNHNQPSCEHTFDIDKPLLKSNCEAIMDFVDYISESKIYSNSEVSRILNTILTTIRAENVDRRKIMVNYLEKNPDKLDDFWEIWDGLASEDGYKYHSSYDNDFPSMYLSRKTSQRKGQPFIQEPKKDKKRKL